LRGRLKDGPATSAASQKHFPISCQAPANDSCGSSGEGGIGGAVRRVGELLGFRLWSGESALEEDPVLTSEFDGDQDEGQVVNLNGRNSVRVNIRRFGWKALLET
jgi:hypothetical protein